jgi:hypothetical protein
MHSEEKEKAVFPRRTSQERSRCSSRSPRPGGQIEIKTEELYKKLRQPFDNDMTPTFFRKTS